MEKMNPMGKSLKTLVSGFVLCALTGIMPFVPAWGQDIEPLNIDLPKPMFIGTPTGFRVNKLEPPRGHDRPPFLAPQGTENVALGKFVESSDPDPLMGDLELVTDGNKEAVDGSFVELDEGLQHITIDLEGRFNIYAIAFWHFHKKARVYSDVIVQVSDDPDFLTGVHTVFNNDYNNSAGFGSGGEWHYVETYEGKLVDAKGAQGQFVRLYSQGNTDNKFNHYIEVEVYGKPVE